MIGANISNPSPAAAIEPTVKLTQDQIDFCHREGYLVVDSISTPAEIEWLKGIYDKLFDQRAGREKGDQFDLGGADEEGKRAVLPQILTPGKYAPELNEGLFRTNGLAIARQLLGPDVVWHDDHAIYKPARYGAETPWHQDEAYWSENREYRSVSLWMPLQPATLENGCMQFVPGSHRRGIVPHHSIGHDPRVHGLEMDEKPDAGAAVACPIPAGGCTIHSNRTFHYAGANRSEIPRRAYIMVFGLPSVPRDQGHNFYWNKAKTTARNQRAQAAQAAARK